MILNNEILFTERIRIARLIIISLLMNTILFLLAYFLNLPLWLDTTGTIYISCIIGFPAGFLVSIIINITESIWIYGESSLLFYFVSLLTALASGKIYEKYKNTKIKKWLLMLICLILVDCTLAVAITFVTSDGIPSNYWSWYLYTIIMEQGVNNIIATFISVSSVKCLDLIVTLLIVAIAIRVTPDKLKTRKYVLLKNEDDLNENKL